LNGDCVEQMLINLNSLPRRAALRILAGFALASPLRTFADSPERRFAAIERGIGVKLGVAALDTGTGRTFSHRGAELFPLCSTFKFLLAGCILSRVDAGKEQLSRSILYTDKDLLEYAPVTRGHVKEGALSVGDLCAAAVEVSDNAAANLLLAQVGGPAGVTSFIRSLGDPVTRLDRTEPDLNSALPGDVRDTTSPTAMLNLMKGLLTGRFLLPASRNRLIGWLEKCETGGNRLRAGVPKDWRAGDKTGTGENGAIGDIGIFWPPNRAPILIAAYVIEGSAPRAQREGAIASAARIMAREFRPL